MTTSQQDYGELMAADLWADTCQSSCAVVGSDGKKRFINFVVHGGTAEITDDNYTNIDRMNDSKLTMYAYLSDGSLEYSLDLPSFSEGSTADSIVDQPHGSIAVYACNGADYLAASASGGFAYVLYGPGCRSDTFAPYDRVTTSQLLFTQKTLHPTITQTANNSSTETASTVASDGSPTNPYAPIGVGWTIVSATGTTVIAASAGGPSGSSYTEVDQVAHDASVLDAQNFIKSTMDTMTTVDSFLDTAFPATDFTENYSCSYAWSNSISGATATTNVSGYYTYRVNAYAAARASFSVMSYSAAQYVLLKINVATGLYSAITPFELTETFSDSDIQFDTVKDYSGFEPVITGRFAAPAGVYQNAFNAHSSSVLAYGDQAWWGHASPTKYPSALLEMGPISGAVASSPNIQYQAVTFPTSSVIYSGSPIINHALASHHTPLEAFRYTFVPLDTGATLTINNSEHMISYAHPRRLPSQDAFFIYRWAWTTDKDPTATVDPLGTIPDNAQMGDRYTMVSGCASVDQPFLFADTQRGLSVVAPSEENPSPAPSVTQFVVPVRDGSGMSKDWRWFQNMSGGNPFYNVPTGVIHLYLVDPLRGLWRYMGPAKESSGAAGTFGTDTSASGPYLTSQRTSRVVNLGGVLACTSLFGALEPTIDFALRDEQDGSDSTYPASTLSTVGFNEALWLVCSNDGTNWVKVQKLTEPYHDLATGKEGDSISLKAGSTKLIGYGPRQCPIASAPCLITKPVGG